MHTRHIMKVLCAALATALSLPLARAADDAATMAGEPDWRFPLSVTLVSDYIFRGQSQSWGRPALQFSAEAVHRSGFYAGFFASNVSDHWLPGASVETDLYGGYRGSLADTISYDAGVVYYAYPGANWNDSIFTGFNASNELDTAEAYLSVTWQWLTFKTGRALTEYFGWSTNNSPVNDGFFGDADAGVTGNTRGSHYYELNASHDVAEGWNVSGQIGRQIIRHATGLDITYYKVGVTRTFNDGWSAGVFYSASSEPDAYTRFVSLDNGRSDSDVAKDKLFVSVTKAF
jgi:uncharacterized protein (TIGR02001 family)